MVFHRDLFLSNSTIQQLVANVTFLYVQSFKEKSKRRQTWAPGVGGISDILKKNMLTIDEIEEDSPFPKKSLSLLRQSISPMNLATLKRASLIKEGLLFTEFNKNCLLNFFSKLLFLLLHLIALDQHFTFVGFESNKLKVLTKKFKHVISCCRRKFHIQLIVKSLLFLFV